VIRQGIDPFSGDREFEADQSPHRRKSTLVVGRRDISFSDVGRDRVAIAVRVTNAGRACSAREVALIGAAPFGAFVNWEPLALLPVPPLDPGESIVIGTIAKRPAALPQGSPDRVSPGQILTALGLNDRGPRPLFPGRRQSDDVSRPARRAAAVTDFLVGPADTRDGAGSLPPSPFDLLGGPDTYWAGNLNIFIGNTDVERHVANALRIVPGRTNAAMFVVGDGSRPESYRFDIIGLRHDWEAAIYDPMNARSLLMGLQSGTQVKPGSWRSLRARSLLLLALKPPAGCDEGNVEVHVTQRSTGKTAVVEFSFDPRAKGPGCYVVE
jgi:hypothetical protein